MVLVIALAVASAVLVEIMWWRVVERPRKRRARAGAERRADPRAVAADRFGPPDEVRVPPELTPEWADRTQVWAALTIENALLADRVAGRLDRRSYRERMVELAWRCEPARGDRC
ncbi:hypothetical protein [Nocardia seriolae]|nr:hypothetical protein [Nocardia seriolae]MTJ64031.1 hypothetical protein [Nocardia seriolae]MTJ71301.1 hypothetical protein [Nocardia seriolae]MTJ88592.1 hypothetical protein [Nocardia seriolae]MTK32576.1 hypothetical protein [Nocardia seriolae]MTK41917.1 hypothetical protein [Nocardia seriolae]